MAACSAESALPVVVDLGSSMCKAGFAAEDSPREKFPSVVSLPKEQGNVAGTDKDAYVGDEAHSIFDERSSRTLNYPVEHGLFTNWTNIETICHHIFSNKLRVAPEEHAVLMAEAPFSSNANRERMAQLMFETFKAPAVYSNIHPLLALYASGRVTGTVLSSGAGVTHSVPIYEGQTLSDTIMRTTVAGNDLTDFMARLLAEQGHSFAEKAAGCSSSSSSRSSGATTLVRDVKEKLCYVALDFEAESKRAAESEGLESCYHLPDGNALDVAAGGVRFRCPEALFQPSLLQQQDSSSSGGSSSGGNASGGDSGGGMGIHTLLMGSLMKVDADIRTKDMYGNLLLSGGSTMFPGIAERLAQEVRACAPPLVRVKVVAPPERKHAAWIGGSILASLPNFPQLCVSRAEYDESGPPIIHQKCKA